MCLWYSNEFASYFALFKSNFLLFLKFVIYHYFPIIAFKIIDIIIHSKYFALSDSLRSTLANSSQPSGA